MPFTQLDGPGALCPSVCQQRLRQTPDTHILQSQSLSAGYLLTQGSARKGPLIMYVNSAIAGLYCNVRQYIVAAEAACGLYGPIWTYGCSTAGR